MSAEPLTPPTMGAGLGRAVPVMPTPIGPVVAEVATIVRVVGDEATAAAILRQLGQLAVFIPPLTLLKLLGRWVARLQDLGLAGQGATLRIRQRLSRGRHREFKMGTEETIR